MTLSMFFKDVKFELLNEFVVLIFAYNLLYENKRHFVGTWDIYIYMDIYPKSGCLLTF